MNSDRDLYYCIHFTEKNGDHLENNQQKVPVFVEFFKYLGESNDGSNSVINIG